MLVRDKHSLKLAQGVPLMYKILMTKKKIREFLDNYPAYISFSGGKDSIVLRHLVHSVDPSIPTVFCDTGMEFPDVRASGMEADVVLKPKLTFNKVIEKYGYPVVSKENSQKIYEVRNTKSDKLRDKRMGKGQGSLPMKWRYLIDAPFKISHMCCHYLKKQPFHKYEKETGNKPIVGIMASESNLRMQSWVRYGCNAFEGKISSRPLMLWTEEDIWQYINIHGLKVPKIYDRVTRTGCMFCLFGDNLEKVDKFEIIKELYPTQYNYFMTKLGFNKVIEYIKGGKHGN